MQRTCAALEVSGYSMRFQTKVRTFPIFESPKFSSACLAASFCLLSSSPFCSFTACLVCCRGAVWGEMRNENGDLLNLRIVFESTARLNCQLINAPELKLLLVKTIQLTQFEVWSAFESFQPEELEHTCRCLGEACLYDKYPGWR